MGLMLIGEANREAPAQAELRPTCAGASCVNLHVILTPMGRLVGPAHPKHHQTRQGCLDRMHVWSVGGIKPAGFDIENAQPSIWTSTKKDYFVSGKMLRQ